MHIYRKILIFIIISVTIYLLYRLLQKKSAIQSIIASNVSKTSEGFSNSDNFSVTNSTNVNLPLREYHIKASIDSAYDGSAMSIDALTHTISHGCRFLDFQIFSVDNVPMVGYSSNKNNGTYESSNTLPLNDVLKTVSTSVFSGVAPNPNDPLFLFLRFQTVNASIFPLIKNILNINLNGTFYKSPVNKDTLLSKLLQKVVILVDNNYYLNLQNTPNSLSAFEKEIVPYINAYCGTPEFPMIKYNSLLNQAPISPQIHENGVTTNVTKLQISIPDGVNPNNPSLVHFIKDHGVQIVPYRFYLKDSELSNYEEFFKEYKTACISMATALLHMKNISD